MKEKKSEFFFSVLRRLFLSFCLFTN